MRRLKQAKNMKRLYRLTCKVLAACAITSTALLVNGGTVFAETVEKSNNTKNISSGTTESIAGNKVEIASGMSVDKAITNSNTVDIKADKDSLFTATIAGGEVVVGEGTSVSAAIANGNEVSITEGTYHGAISGGEIWTNVEESIVGDAQVNNNAVKIISGTFNSQSNSDICGGYVSGPINSDVQANGNTVDIKDIAVNARYEPAEEGKENVQGVFFNRSIYGGYATSKGENGSATAKDNSVTISGGSIQLMRYLGLNLNDEEEENEAYKKYTGFSGSVIYGGYAANGNKNEANINTLTIKGGTIDVFVGTKEQYEACKVEEGAAPEIGGGMADNGTANGNKVSITGGTIGSEGKQINVYGGNGGIAASGNEITINGSGVTIIGDVAGGLSHNPNNKLLEKNRVTIASGTVEGDVFGGCGPTSLMKGNEVIISGGTVEGYVFGGCNDAWNHIADGNKVSITKGSVTGNVYGGSASDGGIAQNNIVDVTGGTATGDIYGGYTNYSGNPAVDEGAINGGKSAEGNIVIIGGGEINNVYGGCSVNGNVINNRVVVTGGTVAGFIYGGYSDEQEDKVDGNIVPVSGDKNAESNIVTISGGNINDVYGGFAVNGKANNNIVNLVGAGGKLDDVENGNQELFLTCTVYGSNISDSTGNSLNVAGKNVSVSNIANFQNLNFYIPVANVDDNVMLTITNAVDLTNVAAFNAIFTVENNDTIGYTPGKTITVLSSEASDFTSLDTSKLKVNGEKPEDATLTTTMDGLGSEIGAKVAYDIAEKTISLSTKSYKLLDETNVTADVILDKELDLNKQTLNMQQAADATYDEVKYNTLTVKKLSGTGDLKVDADFNGNKNDKIEVAEAGSTGTVTLTSILLRSDGLNEDEENVNPFAFITGAGASDVTLKYGTDGTLETSTSDYIYTFKQTDNGVVIIKEIATSINDFITGNRRYKDIKSFDLTENTTVENAIGTLNAAEGSNRGNVFDLGINKNVTLNGTFEGEKLGGIIVAEGYTLNVMGQATETAEDNLGKITGFAIALTNNGTLKVENINFNGNDKDIINNGSLTFTGTNTLNNISGAAGSAMVDSGITTVNAEVEQKDIVIKMNSQLVLGGDAKVTGTLTNTGTISVNGNENTINALTNNGSADINGKENSITTLTNNGEVNLKGQNTITDINGTGNLNVKEKGTSVTGSFAQNNASVAQGAELKLQENAEVTGTLSNKGTVSVDGVKNTINYLVNNGSADINGKENSITNLTNNKTVNLNGTNNTIATLVNNSEANLKGKNIVTTVSGTGSLHVVEGETEVTGGFQQTDTKVTGGKLTLKGEASATNSNVDTNGTLEVGGSLSLSNAFKNDGTVNMKAASTLNKVEGAGTFSINAGTTTVSGGFTQKVVNVNNGSKLVLSGATAVDSMNVANGAALGQNGGSFVVNGNFTNEGDVTLSGLGGGDVDYTDMEKAKNKVSSKLTNTGVLKLVDTYLTVGALVSNKLEIDAKSKMHVLKLDGNLDVAANSMSNLHISNITNTITVVANSGDEGKALDIASSFDRVLAELEAKYNNNELKLSGEGMLIVPEGVLDGKTIFDAKGVHKAKGATEDVIDSMSSAVTFARIEMNDIRKRMGDVRQVKDTNGIWARSENGKLAGEGQDAKFHKFQLGSDKAVSDKWRVGGAVSYTNSNGHYDHGSNSSKTYSGAAYGVYTGTKGEFADVIARVGMDKTKLNFNAASGTVYQTGELDRMAYALSAEVGKTYELKHSFYVEPQAELAYTYNDSDSFTSKSYTYDLDSASSFVGRLGFTLGYKAPENRGSVYTRFSVLREFAGEKKLTAGSGSVPPRTYSNDSKETWMEWAIGGQINTSKATYVYADAEKTFGAKVNEKYRINVGLRYSF